MPLGSRLTHLDRQDLTDRLHARLEASEGKTQLLRKEIRRPAGRETAALFHADITKLKKQKWS